MSTPMRIAVLGGGVAGCVLAQQLAMMPDVEVDLIEREPRLGGLHRSVTIDGAAFDIGAFIFPVDHSIFATFPGLRALFVRVEHLPLSITPRGALDSYPISLRGYLRERGVCALALGVADLAWCKVRWRRRDTLPAYVRYYVGDRFYNQSGLKDYLERFYMASEDAIDLEFARQRLASMESTASVRRVASRLIRRVIERKPDEPWRCCVRPSEGFDVVYGFIAAALAARGVRVRLGARVDAIVRGEDFFDVVVDGESTRYDRVVSTMPLPSMAALLGLGDAAGIEHLTLISLFYRFRGTITTPAHYLYNFTPHAGWKRLVLFSSYYGEHDGDHYFTVECTRRDIGPSSIPDAAADFEAHLDRLSFFAGTARLVGSCVTPSAYPLLTHGHRDSVEPLRRAIASSGIEMAGRQGTFRHLTSHQVADEASALAGRMTQTRPIA
jgi:protoporphyrinogen oxidase